MTTATDTIKISLNPVCVDELEEIRGEYPSLQAVLDRLVERRQGTGSAHYADVSVEEARDVITFLRDRSAELRDAPRGTGAASRRRTLDHTASRILGQVFECEGESVGPISPVGLIQKGKTGKLDAERHTAETHVMEPKLDGWRATVHAEADGPPDDPDQSPMVNVRIFTGNGRLEQAAWVPHIAAELERFMAPGDVVDGEVVVLTGRDDRPDDWGSVQTILGGHPKSTEVSKVASFVAFDCIARGGVDLRKRPFDQRRAALEDLFGDQELEATCVVAQVQPTESALAAILEAGYEGAMIKSREAKYRSGKRDSASAVKVKPQQAEDVRVTGFTEGGGAFAGYVGALCFVGEDGVEGRCSGMDWKTRVAIGTFVDGEFQENTFAPDRIRVGDTVEIAYFAEVGGKRRMPQFKRRRIDK